MFYFTCDRSFNVVLVVHMGVSRNLSWRRHSSSGLQSVEPWMAAVSLPNRVLGRKIDFFVKMYFWGIMEGQLVPLPFLALPEVVPTF